MVVMVKPRKGYVPPVDEKTGLRILKSPFKSGRGEEAKGLPSSPVMQQQRRQDGSLALPKLIGQAATLSEAEKVAGGAVFWTAPSQKLEGVWWKYGYATTR